MSNIETESQSASPRNPVIDLEAEELSEAADTGDESPPKSEEPPPQQPPKEPFLTRGRIMAVAIIAAVIAGAGLYAAFGEGFWSGRPTLSERIDLLEAANHTLNGQVNQMGEAIGALRTDTKKLIDATNAKAEEAAGKADAASQSAAALETRLTEAEKTLAALRTQIAGLGTGTGGGEGPSADALAAIEARLAALEEQVKALEANQGGTADGGGDQATAALSQALSDLKAKFAGGAPYKAEIDVIAKALPDAPGLAELALHAEKGLATAEGLAAMLEALAPELPKSSGNGEDDSGIWAWLGSIVTIRNLDERDWGELALAAAKDAKAGDLRAAIRRLDETGAELPAKLAEWRALAETRLQAESALERLSAAVIAAIAGKS